MLSIGILSVPVIHSYSKQDAIFHARVATKLSIGTGLLLFALAGLNNLDFDNIGKPSTTVTSTFALTACTAGALFKSAYDDLFITINENNVKIK